jgi:hypothetical protein
LPEHTEAYEQLSIICGYIDPKFSQRVFKEIYSRLITLEESASHSKTKKGSKGAHHHIKHGKHDKHDKADGEKG